MTCGRGWPLAAFFGQAVAAVVGVDKSVSSQTPQYSIWNILQISGRMLLLLSVLCAAMAWQAAAAVMDSPE
jgi:hypothetical protein